MNRHSIRRSVTGAVLAAGMAAGVFATAADAQAATTPAYNSWHHHVEGRVVSRVPLSVRYGPGTNHSRAGYVNHGSHVWITCKSRGTRVGSNDRWYRLAGGRGWVAAHYVNNYQHVRWC